MTGPPPSFTLDSNVLVCAVSAGDARQLAAQRIIRLAAGTSGLLTLQALGEFYHVAPRKRQVPREVAAAQVRNWRRAFPEPALASATAMEAAIEASRVGRFGYWDALLLATAAEAGCEAVISEDMAPGAALNGCRVVPAFAAGGAVSAEALALLGGP